MIFRNFWKLTENVVSYFCYDDVYDVVNNVII